MWTTKRKTVAASMLGGVALLATACGSDNNGGGGQSSTAAAPPPASAPAQQQMGTGMTTTNDVFGPGCAQVPTDPSNKGSLQGMVSDPVATAASNNPLLTNLVTAVKSAGLVDTLNKPDAKYTVFAPADPAFAAIPADQLQAMLNDPAQKEKLTSVLTYHVVPQRLDANGIVAAKSLDTVQGGKLTIGGTAAAPTVNGANVLCGNVPTANATVFVIDKVLMPQ